jgi:putative holliday junction resolvase
MGRILGIDYGRKRTGLAVTDPMQMISSPLKTINTGDFFSFTEEYMRSEEVEAFVIGYPLQMNNKPSESVNYINPFIRKLEQSFPGTGIHLVDERFTSSMAARAMIDGGVKKMKRRDKSMVDKISASIILQSFLDRRDEKKEGKR